jgi:single-strand DNA-binding protein
MATGLNQATLIGNVGRDPEIRTTGDGKEIANFSLATTENWKDQATGEKKEKTEWHKIVAFNQGIVSIIKRYVKKGSRIYLQGNIHTRKWIDNSGTEKYSTEIALQQGATLILLDGKNNEFDIKNGSEIGGQGSSNFNHSELDDEIPF